MTDVRIAIIVDPTLPLGLIANTIATIGVGLGAAEPTFGGNRLTDRLGRSLSTSSNRPIPILQAPSETIRALLLKALSLPEDRVIVPFPQFARSLHAFEEYLVRFPRVDLAEEVIEGVGLAGPEKWIKSLTGSLKLLR